MTEIAPFPDFRKNLKIGDTYNSFLWIGAGWGNWTGKEIKSKYVIADVEKEEDDTLWTIDATSELAGKTSNCRFILSEKKEWGQNDDGTN